MMSELPRPISHTTTVVPFKDNQGYVENFILTQLLYEDGSIKQQYGEGKPWEILKEPDGVIKAAQEIEIFEPNKDIEIALVCINCNCPLHKEDDEWFFSIQAKTAWHRFQDDCDGAHQPAWVELESRKDIRGNCEKCGNIIMYGDDSKYSEGGISHVEGDTKCRK